MKKIIWEYHKAFDIAQIEIAMIQRKENYLMVIQDLWAFFHEAPCKDMIEYMKIDDWSCMPARSKTIEIDESFFSKAYKTITESLMPIYNADHAQGLDGDGLTVKIESGGGHRCEFYFWAPGYYDKDRYKTDRVYEVFMCVLERAGLSEWYKASR